MNGCECKELFQDLKKAVAENGKIFHVIHYDISQHEMIFRFLDNLSRNVKPKECECDEADKINLIHAHLNSKQLTAIFEKQTGLILTRDERLALFETFRTIEIITGNLQTVFGQKQSIAVKVEN